ncbi:hypothetical protein ACIBKX_14820 [Streptomyces sp. NPDC050658]|uniref:hypothetical protein n=1 Tax=unclassified Streptomyces TaxID=2593676 RepID=UPI0034291ED2
MTISADPHRPMPTRIPGYDGGPLTHPVDFLDDPLFWLGHLASCARSEESQELLFGADHDAASEFQNTLWERADWPTFTVTLAAGHRLPVVCRTAEGEAGIDYLLHHPDWPEADLLARDDGHFMGPGLSWSELAAAASPGPPGGSPLDAHARLLLLLPALGDDTVPTADAVARVAAALRACTAVENPDRLAELMLEYQGAPGPAHWTTTGNAVRVNDGGYSFRNPANSFALPAAGQARVTAALAP